MATQAGFEQSCDANRLLQSYDTVSGGVAPTLRGGRVVAGTVSASASDLANRRWLCPVRNSAQSCAPASKNLRRETHLPIAPYFGVAYGTYEDRLRPIGGLNIGFAEWLTSLVVFDGVHIHPMLTYSHKRHVFSFILVRAHIPGVSYSITF